MCLVKHLEVYVGPSKCSALAVIIRESLQEKVTHKGRTVFQGRNRQKDVRGRESPIGKSSPGPRGASKGRRRHSVGWRGRYGQDQRLVSNFAAKKCLRQEEPAG